MRPVVDAAATIGHEMRREIDVSADDRLHLLIFARLKKLHRAVQRAVVRERKRAHAERLRTRNERLGLGKRLKERIMRMRVEVDEILGIHGGKLPQITKPEIIRFWAFQRYIRSRDLSASMIF